MSGRDKRLDEITTYFKVKNDKQLSIRLGIHQATLSNVRRGQDIRQSTREKIQEGILPFSVEWLLTGKGEKLLTDAQRAIIVSEDMPVRVGAVPTMPGPRGEELNGKDPGEIVRIYREARGWSAGELVRKLGVLAADEILDIEKYGIHLHPGRLISWLVPLANVLGIPQESFVNYYWNCVEQGVIAGKYEGSEGFVSVLPAYTEKTPFLMEYKKAVEEKKDSRDITAIMLAMVKAERTRYQQDEQHIASTSLMLRQSYHIWRDRETDTRPLLYSARQITEEAQRKNKQHKK